MKNLGAIFGGHDANITFYNAETNKYYVIELERLVKKRYFRLHVDNPQEVQFDIFKQCQIIEEKNLPVIPIESKSGGLHIYVFTKEKVSATLIREFLSNLLFLYLNILLYLFMQRLNRFNAFIT